MQIRVQTDGQLFTESSESKFKKLVNDKLTLSPKLQGLTYEQFYKKYETLIELVNRYPVGKVINEGIHFYDNFTTLVIAIDRDLEVLAMQLLNSENMTTEIINARCERGITALHCAARRGNVAIATALLNRGALHSIENSYGNYAIHFAAMSGNPEMVSLILKDTNEKQMLRLCGQEGKLALHFACEAGNAASVLMITGLMDPECIANECAEPRSPLKLAIKAGCLQAVRCLLAKLPGFKFDESYLELAALSGNVDLFVFLKDAGAPYVRNNYLKEAIMSGNEAMVAHLLQNGLVKNLNDFKLDGDNYLHMTIRTGNLAMAKLLVEAGIDIEVFNRNGLTPIRMSIYEEQQAIALYLYEKDAACSRADLEKIHNMNVQPLMKTFVKPDHELPLDPDGNYNPLAGVCCIC